MIRYVDGIRGFLTQRGFLILILLISPVAWSQKPEPETHGTGFVLPPPDDPFWRMETVPRDYEKETFPAVFDWRTLGGVTPAKDQGSCGSCWAFATIGVAEAAIKIRDGIEVDLSEQHLLGCNSSNWGCSGALWAYQWLIDTQDKCGRIGALLESQLPYTGSDSNCNCAPQPVYRFNGWGYVNGLTPSVADIKSALMRYGPIGAGVVSSVLGSGSGVIGGCPSYSIFDVDHVLLIVGWDDTKGSAGAWIIKNSWGTYWGDNGYAYIEYGCGQIGFGATYVTYGDGLAITPAAGLDAEGDAGGPFTPSEQTYTLRNEGSSAISWSATAPAWISLSQTGGSLAAGAQTSVTATINAATLQPGTYSGDVVFVNAATGYEQRRRFTLTVRAPILYAFPLDTDPGWARTGDWAFGWPTGQGSENPDPTAGYTGNNVFGNNLNGNYANNASAMTLTAGPFDFSRAHGVTLEFQRWLGVERNSYDKALLQVSQDGSVWYTLWENPDTDLAETSWSRQVFDLSARADGSAAFYVRWVLGPTDDSVTYSGWNIDDIVFRGIQEGGGTDPGDPVAVTSVEDLQKIGNDPAWPANGRYYLSADLDASATASWNGGAGFSPIVDFSGEFDGQGHTIGGLVINRPGLNQVGLFGTVSSSGQIRNLGLENANIRGNLFTGGIAGVNRGSIASCMVTGTVTGSDATGGIVGSNSGGSITDCRVSATVTGGLRTGGAVGENSGPLARILSTGPVTGSSGGGGLAGWNSNSITASFWDTETSGVSWSAGGTGLSTAALKQRATYESAGWDFSAVWYIRESVDYPVPAWAAPPDTPDSTPPTPPVLQSVTHSVGGLSNQPVIRISWAGAADPESGIAGYAWLFTQDPNADPGTVVQTPHSADPHVVDSDALADGTWYFRLRAKNGYGLWSDPVSWGPVTIDTAAPAVSLIGADAGTAECGSPYTDPGATAWDSREGDVSNTLVLSGEVNTAVPGTYALTWTATDGAGNVGTATRQVQVLDTQPPVVTLNGAAEITLACGDTWTDPGASAIDACEGNLQVTVSGSVNPNAVGTYTLLYTAADSTGQSASVQRVVRVTDTQPPVVTLNGAAEVTLACGDTWTDPGASAIDACEGNLQVTVSGSVNPNAGGTYTLLYTATDSSGQSASVQRTVRVTDTQPPVVTLNGDAEITLACGDSWTDPGASAIDACEGNLQVTVSGSVNTNAGGTYTLLYTATDSSGQSASVQRTVRVTDTQPPVVALNGDAEITLACGDTWTDPGASAMDACEGNLQVTVSGSVNPNAGGTYTLLYTATDSSGQSASVQRTVWVTDTQPPVVTLNGDAEVTLACGDPWTDPGASAMDACEGNLQVTVSGSVNPNAGGTYTLLYTATDSAGQSASVQRTVRVEDSQPPVVTLNGDAEITLACGDTWTDPGASAIDACEGNLQVMVTGAVNPSAVGTYPLLYTATDSFGQSASVQRTVRVEDSQPPVVTLLGERVMAIRQYDAFTDPGAQATDICDGDLPVTVSGQVSTGSVGLYRLDYAAVDRQGNRGAAQRTILVNPRVHCADTNGNGRIDLEELLRVIQLFRAGQYSIAAGAATEDGYQPGEGSHDGPPHDADYAPADWKISVMELMRLIQLYHQGGYVPCPDGEDLFCGGPR